MGQKSGVGLAPAERGGGGEGGRDGGREGKSENKTPFRLDRTQTGTLH